jgi:hypothetical protein
LRTLDLADCAIHSAGAGALLNSPYLARLTTLGLVANHVPAKLLKALRDRFGDV